MKRLTSTRRASKGPRKTGVVRSAADNFPGVWRVEDCELHFKDGEMAVTFRLSLPATSALPTPTPRRVPPRPSKAKS